jgi:hypothetical protein
MMESSESHGEKPAFLQMNQIGMRTTIIPKMTMNGMIAIIAMASCRI